MTSSSILFFPHYWIAILFALNVENTISFEKSNTYIHFARARFRYCAIGVGKEDPEIINLILDDAIPNKIRRWALKKHLDNLFKNFSAEEGRSSSNYGLNSKVSESNSPSSRDSKSLDYSNQVDESFRPGDGVIYSGNIAANRTTKPLKILCTDLSSNIEALRRTAQEIAETFNISAREVFALCVGGDDYNRNTNSKLFTTVEANNYDIDDQVEVERLSERVLAGDMDYVRETLTRNPELVNVASKRTGKCPLHQACFKGTTDFAVAAALLDKGADIEAKDKSGCTVLHYAANIGNLALVSFLLERGADVNAVNKAGWTALFFASDKGNNDIVSLLSTAGANLNVLDQRDESPLHRASTGGQYDTVALLLDLGADVNIGAEVGATPLQAVLRQGNRANVGIADMLLLRGADVNVKDLRGDSLLHLAIDNACNDIGLLKLLLRAGVDVEAENAMGDRPLHYACMRGQTKGDMDALALILEEGVDPNPRNNNMETPLHSALSRGGQHAAISMLLEHGADIAAEDSDGNTPLHKAMERSDWQIIHLLLNGGPNIEARNKYGYTPLHMACARGHEVGVSYLLKMGANPQAVTDEGLTPLDIVRSIQRSAKRSPVREEAKGALGTSKKQATTATRQGDEDLEGTSSEIMTSQDSGVEAGPTRWLRDVDRVVDLLLKSSAQTQDRVDPSVVRSTSTPSRKRRKT